MSDFAPGSANWQTLFQREISAARSVKSCTAAFGNVLRRFDVDCFACGEVDLLARARSIFYVIEWPDSWRRFYLESGLVEKDPLLDALATRDDPFSWTELIAGASLPPESRHAFALAAKAGWTEGLVVPLGRSERRVGLVSLAARRPDFTADEKAALTLASVFFHQRLRALIRIPDFAEPPARLTAREVECLAMVATGSSDREIGEALGISPTTAHEHVEGAKRKLHSKSRAAAVAISVALGIVRV